MTTLKIHRGRVLASVDADPEEVGDWAARCNIDTQEALLENIATAAEQPAEIVAERLGITTDELRAALTGRSDLTMTEIRLLAIASDLIIGYNVRSARSDYRDKLRAIGEWTSIKTRNAGLGAGSRDALDPAEFGRRAARAVS